MKNKKLNEVLFITEDIDTGKWILSWMRPDFQQKLSSLSLEISEEDAKKIINITK